VETITDHLHSIQKHYEKSGGKNKTYDAVLDTLTTLIDALSCLAALVRFVPGVSTVAVDHWDVPGVLADAYTDLVPLLGSKFAELSPMEPTQQSKCVRLLKLKMVDGLHAVLDVEFLRRLESDDDGADADALRLCAVLSALLDRQESLHTSCVALSDAPLLVDLDALLGLRRRLRRIVNIQRLGDPAPLEHALGLLDQLCLSVDLMQVTALCQPAVRAFINRL
jgi:hypothetical protein